MGLLYKIRTNKKLILLGILMVGLVVTVVTVKQIQNLLGNAQELDRIEAENAAAAGNVTVFDDPNASGGKYVKLRSASQISGTTYYLDCSSGNDSNNGTSQAAAWKSLSKANTTPLTPGDGLLLKKGCTWTGTLTISKSGNATNKVFVSNYGSGELPIIQSSSTTVVSIAASNTIVEGIYSKAIAPGTSAGCQNNPVGHVEGFAFQSGATNNILRDSKASGGYAGVYLKAGSSNNKILNNEIIDNKMMSPLDTGGNNDAGAFGVLIWGDDNEIAYNTVAGNNACSLDYVTDGASFEVYGGQRNNFHHNTTFNNDAFAELGNSRSADNTFAFNSFTSTSSRSLFLVTRGPNDTFGPVLRTKLYNNTVYLPSTTFKPVIICYAGCTAETLFMRNNIVQGGAGSIDADGPINENYNLFAGTVKINGGSAVGANSIKATPLFINAIGGNLRLQPSSPGVNTGSGEVITAGYTTDLDGTTLLSGSINMGAFDN